jgi:threonine aldolase
MRTFRSDNNAGLCPEALAAINEASSGHVIGYGDDHYSAQAVQEFRKIFGSDAAVYFVATGTAANTLCIASLTQPWSQVICHHHSHCSNDESTAPERVTHCRIVAVRNDSSKITPDDLAACLHSRGDVHQPQPGVVTISNTTELGDVYYPEEIRELADAAHQEGYGVHVDGARFANAVAALDCDPKEITVDAGVDALCFGGTKNGLAYGESVLFFPQGDGEAYKRAVSSFEYHRKGTGHLLSKHRFVAAPFAATLRDGSWLRHARHANAMTKKLADGLTQLGLKPRFAVRANALFVTLPSEVDQALQAAGHAYYPFGEPAWNVVRLMCSFDTQLEDVNGFLNDAGAALGR